MIQSAMTLSIRLSVAGLLVAALCACGTVSSLGKSTVRGVNRVGESVAGRLNMPDWLQDARRKHVDAACIRDRFS